MLHEEHQNVDVNVVQTELDHQDYHRRLCNCYEFSTSIKVSLYSLHTVRTILEQYKQVKLVLDSLQYRDPDHK